MEQVLCYRRKDLERIFGAPLPSGAVHGPSIEEVVACTPDFVLRDSAEHDSSLKQLIPYQVFSCRKCFFVYRRGGGVGEGRLAGRLSIGIGGHINLEDTGPGRVFTMAEYVNALQRERREELAAFPEQPGRFVGWLNDDSNHVGRVHIGAVHLVEVSDENHVLLRPGGEDIHLEGWWEMDGLKENAARFESWSQMVVSLL